MKILCHVEILLAYSTSITVEVSLQ